ncbi:protein phosphatase Slingshot homolog 3 [Ambystoma mexicanum]|uniref:protein phosphatase Slingshot homolog 3 n=1 Tax=Ambystoma mexicanum TaxID=8296 RepID=UPI0037E9A982
MSLITLHRSPSGSGRSTPTTTKDEEVLRRRSRFQRRHSFVMVKGAALLLQEEEEETEASSSPSSLHKTHKRNKSNHDQDLQQRGHLQAMVDLLRPEDSIKLAVRLESVKLHRIRYLLVVAKMGCDGEDETILLGVDFPKEGCNLCTIGMVLPVWSNTQVFLDGDGGFSVTSDNETRIFKPISVQTMWSMMQVLHKACECAFHHNHFPASSLLGWVQHYQSAISSEQSCINEWMAMSDLLSVRPDSPSNFTEQPSEREIAEHTVRAKLREVMMTTDLETITSKEIRNELERRMNCNLKEYKEFIDNEMLLILAQMDRPSRIFDYLYLGSEWNASNLEELQRNGVGHILNVTREIDNFFPESLNYLNVRVYDEETTDLLHHWKETYRFISNARKQNSRVLVHCKMGVSRSGSTVIAYAMKEYGWSLDEALRYVKEKRSIVNPNPGFMKQLLIYQGILDASKQRHNDLWELKTKYNQSDSPGLITHQPPKGNDDMPNETQQGHEKPSPIEEEGSSEASEEEEESEEEMDEADKENQPLKSPPYCFRPLEVELDFLAVASPKHQAEQLLPASLGELSQPTICIQRTVEEEGGTGNHSDDSNAEEVISHLGGTETASGPPSALAVPESPLTPRRQRINLWSVMRSISEMGSVDQETPPRSPAENTNNSNGALGEAFDPSSIEAVPAMLPLFTGVPEAQPPICMESEGPPQNVPSKPRGKKRLPRQPRPLLDKETGAHQHRPNSGGKVLARNKLGDKKLQKQVSYQFQVGKVRKQARALERLKQNQQGLSTADWQNCAGGGDDTEDVLSPVRPRLKHLQSVAELNRAALVSRQTKAFESSQRLQQTESEVTQAEDTHGLLARDLPAVTQGEMVPSSIFHEHSNPEHMVKLLDSYEKGPSAPRLERSVSEPKKMQTESEVTQAEDTHGLLARDLPAVAQGEMVPSSIFHEHTNPEHMVRLLDSDEKGPSAPRLERSVSGPKKMVHWETVDRAEPPTSEVSKCLEISHENGAS